MAIEKFIRGKRDDCHHDGRAANTRRLQKALEDEAVGEQLYVSMNVYSQRSRLPASIVQYHENILRAWGLLPEETQGIIYPLDNEGKTE